MRPPCTQSLVSACGLHAHRAWCLHAASHAPMCCLVLLQKPHDATKLKMFSPSPSRDSPALPAPDALQAHTQTKSVGFTPASQVPVAESGGPGAEPLISVAGPCGSPAAPSSEHTRKALGDQALSPAYPRSRDEAFQAPHLGSRQRCTPSWCRRMATRTCGEAGR